MQPYFFPYLGYLGLIRHSDHFVIFDSPQFIRHGWIERNRILKPQDGWQYIKVPIEKHSRDTTIKDIRIRGDHEWRNKIFAQLTHYKKKAKYYYNVIELLQEILTLETNSITDLNTFALKKVCDYLDIKFNYSKFTELKLDLGQINGPDEWALEISKAMNADEYINLPSGKEFFNKHKYSNAGIKLSFLEITLQTYEQHRPNFEKGLSIIDIMMFNPPSVIVNMLDCYEFE